MSRRRYFEEQRSGNGAIYHCVETEIEPGDRIRLFNLMNKRNAGGGSGETNTGVVFQGGISDYSEGSGTGGSTNGSGKGGGGYGGGGGGVRYSMVYAGAGGDGTVLIRGRRYKL